MNEVQFPTGHLSARAQPQAFKSGGGKFIINLILESSFFLCCKYVSGCHWEQSGYGSLLTKQ